jgi:hypothetical protein
MAHCGNQNYTMVCLRMHLDLLSLIDDDALRSGDTRPAIIHQILASAYPKAKIPPYNNNRVPPVPYDHIDRPNDPKVPFPPKPPGAVSARAKGKAKK